jgi:DNA-binding GntR family transcriptional regulator
VTRLHRETMADQAAAELRRRILDGELRPGDPVTEDAMAADLGVSRTTMRQVLNTLMLEGLLTRHERTRVLQVTTLSRSDVVDIYRARRFLELGGVAAAAGAGPAGLAAIRTALAELARAVEQDDPEAFVEADYRCHAEIVALLGSRHLAETHRLLMSKLRLAITQVTAEEQDDRESLDRHRKFYDLLSAGEIDRARDNLAARLDEAERAVLAKATATD